MASVGSVMENRGLSQQNGLGLSSPPKIKKNPHIHLQLASARERSSSTDCEKWNSKSLPRKYLTPNPPPTASLPFGSSGVPRVMSLRGFEAENDSYQYHSADEGDQFREGSDNLARSFPQVLLSPRFTRKGFGRQTTIDTKEINKEEYDDHLKVNQYKVLDIIGHGSYGIVRKATDSHNEVYAMKIVGKQRMRRKSFAGRRPGVVPKDPLVGVRKEIAILKKLNHPNVVKLMEVLDDPHEDDLILVFEHIRNGSVMDTLPTEKTLSEEQSREYFIDVMLGLEYLHSQHVIHRDIKPENLLLDDNNVIKIADFGVSEELDTSSSELTKSAGTPAFIAPECLDLTKKTFRGQEADIWAAGVTLYCFIYGKVPFQAPGIVELHDMIRKAEILFPPEVVISLEVRDLFLKLLEKDPMKRIKIADIRKHPWILMSPQAHDIPSQEENCRGEIAVSEEDIKTALKPFITPIHILVMVKKMVRNRSLSNPYSPRTSPFPSPSPSPTTSPRFTGSPAASPRRVRKTSDIMRQYFASSRQNPVVSVNVDDASP